MVKYCFSLEMNIGFLMATVSKVFTFVDSLTLLKLFFRFKTETHHRLWCLVQHHQAWCSLCLGEEQENLFVLWRSVLEIWWLLQASWQWVSKTHQELARSSSWHWWSLHLDWWNNLLFQRQEILEVQWSHGDHWEGTTSELWQSLVWMSLKYFLFTLFCWFDDSVLLCDGSWLIPPMLLTLSLLW